ncbi:MAG: response regulator [Polyangiaceae bacterium]|nr:response regulator [Polyangiaceae bacterium]
MSTLSPLVLVADDEPSMLELVARHLRTLSDPTLDVIQASDGEEAWRLARERRPDLVVLDVMMPGMSGWEVCRKIRQDNDLSHTGVLMLTGIGENLNQMTSPLYGADAYIDKPFEFEDFDDRIRQTLRGREKERALVVRQGVNGTAGAAKPAIEATEATETAEPARRQTSISTKKASEKKALAKPVKKKASAKKSSAKPAKKAAKKSSAKPVKKKSSAKKSSAKPVKNKASAKKALAAKSSKKAAKKASAKKASTKPAKKKASAKPAKKKASAKKSSAKR